MLDRYSKTSIEDSVSSFYSGKKKNNRVYYSNVKKTKSNVADSGASEEDSVISFYSSDEKPKQKNDSKARKAKSNIVDRSLNQEESDISFDSSDEKPTHKTYRMARKTKSIVVAQVIKNSVWTASEVEALTKGYRKYKEDNWEQILLDIPTKTFEQVSGAIVIAFF